MSASVYLLWSGGYDEYVVGAYSTLRLAEAAHDGDHKPEWEASGEDRWTCAFHVAEVLAKGGTFAFELLTIPVVGGVATLPDGRLIRSTAQAVSIPVMPNGLPDIGTPPESCDYAITREDLDR